MVTVAHATVVSSRYSLVSPTPGSDEVRVGLEAGWDQRRAPVSSFLNQAPGFRRRVAARP